MIEAKIIRDNGEIIVGVFNLDDQVFHFNIISNQDFSSCLKVKGINNDGDILISYIFNGDYMPRLFVLKDGSPLVINDYVSFNNELDEHIRIEIKK